ncbi:hypothetical protein Avbf_16368 [Armadillidium vulgare]|nr:hypothetical protein Avbf_16368 [Armadillidium vulgare]
MSLKSGHRIVPVLFEEAEKQYEHFRRFRRTGTVRLDPDGWFYPTPFIALADNFYDFKFKPSDVVIMTFPKSGTTWTQEIVWTMDLINRKIKPVNVCISPLSLQGFRGLNLTNYKIEVKVSSQFMASPQNNACKRSTRRRDHVINRSSVNIAEPGTFLHDKFLQDHPNCNPKDGIFLQLTEFAEDPRNYKDSFAFFSTISVSSRNL